MIQTEGEARARIAEIDEMFEKATGWGSWMVSAANEREGLADRFGLPQKWQARCDGRRVTD
jgi:hypothetical protein